jgi:hypothetical protein
MIILNNQLVMRCILSIKHNDNNHDDNNEQSNGNKIHIINQIQR